MKMDFDVAQGHWLFTDDYGTLWRLRPVPDRGMPLMIVKEQSGPVKPRYTADDMGIDEQGRPFMVGDEAGREQARIIEHPNAKPVLIIAELEGEVGVRVYGPPTQATAILLDRIANDYRTVVAAALAKRQ